MTTVKIYRNKDNRIISFEASGHSNNKAIAGNDIYCAAISAIIQTAVIGLTDYLKIQTENIIKDGFLSCKLLNTKKDADNSEVITILETMRLGLLSFSMENGKYIRIIEEVF